MVGAIVHEWIEERGGAEKVLEQLVEVFPDSEITCLWNDRSSPITAAPVNETWMARTPLRRHKAAALPFMPATWRNLPAAEVDWILCSSHLFAHHARVRSNGRYVPKFVYAYTPARYIWEPELDARGTSRVVRAASAILKPLDRKRAQEATSIVSISNFVQRRIERTWGVESSVIYPPVDVAAFDSDAGVALSDPDMRTLSGLPDEFVFGASRFVPYKNLNLVIEFGEANGLPVVIAGDGPMAPQLREQARLAAVPVTVLDPPSHALLRALYSKALVYVFLAEEDFGIMPVEAMATGTSVVGLSSGGVSETIVDGISGTLIEEYSVATARDALSRALKLAPEAIHARAAEFSNERFRESVAKWIDP